MTQSRSALAANLKTLRERKGFSQKGLGAAAGVSFRSIQNAEQGISDLGADSLVALADTLGVTVDALVRADLPAPAPTVEALTAIIQDQERRLKYLEQRQAPGAMDDALLNILRGFDKTDFGALSVAVDAITKARPLVASQNSDLKKKHS